MARLQRRAADAMADPSGFSPDGSGSGSWFHDRGELRVALEITRFSQSRVGGQARSTVGTERVSREPDNPSRRTANASAFLHGGCARDDERVEDSAVRCWGGYGANGDNHSAALTIARDPWGWCSPIQSLLSHQWPSAAFPSIRVCAATIQFTLAGEQILSS